MTFDTWLAALEERHLANLTRSEVTRALRALSSCYVERRARLGEGGALDGAGKRAAFALFYGPLHFLVSDAVVRATGAAHWPVDRIVDLGCGTGAAGAAWALACVSQPAIAGVDRNRWAVDEANWTYGALGISGRARAGDLVRDFPARVGKESAILLAYAVNELTEDARRALLSNLEKAIAAGAALLVIEPIARGIQSSSWMETWQAHLSARFDEWRFPASLPRSLRDLAKGAGLQPRELTARTLTLGPMPRRTSPPDTGPG